MYSLILPKINFSPIIISLNIIVRISIKLESWNILPWIVDREIPLEIDNLDISIWKIQTCISNFKYRYDLIEFRRKYTSKINK